MEISFKNKVVLVTGAARGIGKSIADQFAREGAYVIVIDKDQDAGAKVIEDIKQAGGDGEFRKQNLKNVGDLVEMISGYGKRFGKLDVLINNARYDERTLPLSETEQNFKSAVDVSLVAPLILSQEFIRVNSTQNNHDSSIVNISSVAASYVGGESAAYHIVKAGLESMTRYLACHGGRYGARVNAIRPGFIVQDEHLPKYKKDDNKQYRELAESCHPLNKVGTADDVVSAIIYLCSNQAKFITGQVLTVDGGLTIQDQWHIACNMDTL